MTTSMIHWRCLHLLVCLLCCVPQGITLAETRTENPVGPLYPLNIETRDGLVSLQVEIARTPAEMSMGLMFRESMPQEQGMIFLHSQPKRLRMWMKNTFIALDMLFIDQWAKVQHIHSNAIPHDETIIDPPVASIAVLELNAGAAEQLGIQVGDNISLSIPQY